MLNERCNCCFLPLSSPPFIVPVGRETPVCAQSYISQHGIIFYFINQTTIKCKVSQ